MAVLCLTPRTLTMEQSLTERLRQPTLLLRKVREREREGGREGEGERERERERESTVSVCGEVKLLLCSQTSYPWQLHSPC